MSLFLYCKQREKYDIKWNFFILGRMLWLEVREVE